MATAGLLQSVWNVQRCVYKDSRYLDLVSLKDLKSRAGSSFPQLYAISHSGQLCREAAYFLRRDSNFFRITSTFVEFLPNISCVEVVASWCVYAGAKSTFCPPIYQGTCGITCPFRETGGQISRFNSNVT